MMNAAQRRAHVRRAGRRPARAQARYATRVIRPFVGACTSMSRPWPVSATTRTWLREIALLFVLLARPTAARADVALLVEQPYGRFGAFNPTGHTAVYLTRICATSPSVLRRCTPGETGVVVSRYHRVAGRDWMAIPLIPYLYAVDAANHVPPFADAAMVAALRNRYRAAHLRALIPDGPGGSTPRGEWIQLVGAAYDRQVVAFLIDTTAAQDDDLIRALNEQQNRQRFHLLFRNCADFAKDIINRYYPDAVRRSVVADLGITTPKQLAKSVVRYDERHPAVHLTTFRIAQIPGSRPPSQGVHGVLESVLRSKKYVVPLTAVDPWLSVGVAAGYFTSGRFNADRYTVTLYSPDALEQQACRAIERPDAFCTADRDGR